MSEHLPKGSVDIRLTTSSVRLRAIDPTDYRSLRQAEVASPIAFRWRLQGQHIPPENYPETLWNGALAVFAYNRATDTSRSEPLGVVIAYNPDPRHGHCYVGAASFEAGASIGCSLRLVDAVGLLLDFIFQGWNFRKIYFECAEYNLPQFQSFIDECQPEGNLVEHLWLSGRYWDLGIWSLSRESWSILRSRLGRW